MKLFKGLILLTGVPVFLGMSNNLIAARKILMPEICRTSKYSCILKKLDGESFLCVRTAKQRQQKARQKVRIVRGINCLERYPVEYEEITVEPANKE